MKPAEINELLVRLNAAPYSDANKRRFRSLSIKFLKAVREQLGIDADVRFNPGGIAIPGDAILHGDDIYITFGGSGVCDWILYRTVKSRKDYTGGSNHQFTYSRLREVGVQGFTAAVQQLRATQATQAVQQ